jgi:hypothetical protein
MNNRFENKFSWSFSRDRLFSECPRKYYFNYYGHWLGWEASAPLRTREIYVLKQLKNRATWIGEVVHDCIARTLRNLSRGIPILHPEEILTITRNRMRQDFRSSREKRYWQNPRAHCGLFEHEYGIEVTDSEWKAAADHVDQCLSNFYGSSYFREFKEMNRSNYLEIEEFSSFFLDHVEVKIKLDCACMEDDRVIIWDWKTGRSEKGGDSIQMACYAFYATQAYTVRPEQVLTRLFDLHRGTLHERASTQRSVDEVLDFVRGSIRDMLNVLEDAEQNTAREEDFAKAERPEICLKCNFLKVCQPNI